MNLDVDIFYEILYDIIDACVPKVRKKSNFPPYFSLETRKLIRRKIKIHKKWKTYNNLSDHLEFKRLRALGKQYIRRDYEDYRRSVESEILENPSKFFQFVSAKRNIQGCPNEMSIDNKTAMGGKDISDLFADFFEKVYVRSDPVIEGVEMKNDNSSFNLNNIHFENDEV